MIIEALKKLIKIPKNMDTTLNSVILFILVFGALCSTSASMSTSTTLWTTIKSIIKIVIIDGIGIGLYLFFANWYNKDRINTRKAYNYVYYFGLGSLALALACCYLEGPINGNYSWIYISGIPFTLQPSEFTKAIAVITIAFYFGDRSFKKNFSSFDVIKKPVVGLLLYFAIIMFVQNDNGSALVLALLSMILFLLPKNELLKGWQKWVIFLLFLIIAVIAFLLSPYGQQYISSLPATFAARFEAVINPSYGSDATREIFYSLLGIAKGGIFGVGIGDSVQKFGYLVSSEADYVFSVICEELGLIGIFIVFISYGILLYRLVADALKMDNESDKIIIMGTACYLGLHFVLNIGGVSGFLPLTGVPLLLLSRGGSATFSIMSLLGMCQGIVNSYHIKKAEKRAPLNRK